MNAIIYLVGLVVIVHVHPVLHRPALREDIMAVVTTTTDAPSSRPTCRPGAMSTGGPIILGTLGALAITVVLMTFGGALGLSVTSAQPYAGLSAKALAVLAGLYAALVHVASFATGGYLAGRLRTPWATTDTRREPLPRRRPWLRGVGAGRRAGRGASPCRA